MKSLHNRNPNPQTLTNMLALLFPELPISNFQCSILNAPVSKLRLGNKLFLIDWIPLIAQQISKSAVLHHHRSERTSKAAPGEPGQRHEAGKAFGCSV
jgi:hypothetical protein